MVMQDTAHNMTTNNNPNAPGRLINSSPDDPGKMFVGGLSWETDENKLKTYFSQFGEVRDVMIKRDQATGQSRGFGFVLFANSSSVDQVLKTEHLLDNKSIDPKRARALRKDNKLFVGGLNPDTLEETIRQYFSSFGEIDCIERPKDRNTQKFRGFCFIAFAKDGVVKSVIDQSKFHTIDGRQCECKDGDAGKKTGGGRGRGGGTWGSSNTGAVGAGAMTQSNQYGYGQWPMAQQWYGAYGAGYDYNSGYGGYGAYGGYGGYGGYGAYAGYGAYNAAGYMQPQQAAAAQTNGTVATQNTGGKTRTAGRGGQTNFKPY